MVKAGETETAARPPRDAHADAVRGIGIAALVLSHTLTISAQTPQVAGMNDLIIAWNMPLFFFLAGWAMALGRARGPLQTARRRTMSLLVPYLAWIGLLWVSGYPWSGGVGGVGTWYQILLAPTEMWFLYCLFLATVIFTFVRAVGRHPAAVLAGTLVLALAATAATRWVPADLLTLGNLGWLLPFLAAGYYGSAWLAKRPPRLPVLAKAGIAVVAFALLWVTVGSDASRAALTGYWPLSLVASGGAGAELVSHAARYAVAAAGVAAVWHVLRLVAGGAERALGALGIATLGVYALNTPLLTLVRLGFPAWSTAAGSALAVLVALSVAGAVLGLAWLVTTLLARYEVTRRVLLGRWDCPPGRPGA